MTSKPAVLNAARVQVSDWLHHRSRTEELSGSVAESLRALGAEQYGSVTAFAEAVAERAGIKALTVRNHLYGSPSEPIVRAALELLGFTSVASRRKPKNGATT